MKRPTELGEPPMCQRHFTRPRDTGKVLDAESCREAWKAGETLEQHRGTIGRSVRAMERPTELRAPLGCQRHFSRPRDIGRVLDAESCREGVESWGNAWTSSKNFLKVFPSDEEADRA